MSADIELLRLAAKAAGIIPHHIDDDGVWYECPSSPKKMIDWNPLKYGGYSCDLAEKLGLTKEENRHLVTKWIDNKAHPYWRTSSMYAITCAADEIGRAMP